jgi:hypothetical protein
MTTPTPNEQHRRLELLAGVWRGTETMHPSQWDPNGGTAEGTNEIRVALNGFALVTDYRQLRDGQPTWDMSRPGIMGSRMETSNDGAEWSTLFECDYERV